MLPKLNPFYGSMSMTDKRIHHDSCILKYTRTKMECQPFPKTDNPYIPKTDNLTCNNKGRQNLGKQPA